MNSVKCKNFTSPSLNHVQAISGRLIENTVTMFQISENMRTTLALIGQQRQGQAQIHQAEVRPRPPQAESLLPLQDLALARLQQVQRQLQLVPVLQLFLDQVPQLRGRVLQLLQDLAQAQLQEEQERLQQVQPQRQPLPDLAPQLLLDQAQLQLVQGQLQPVQAQQQPVWEPQVQGGGREAPIPKGRPRTAGKPWRISPRSTALTR